jgi:hypothetical protein
MLRFLRALYAPQSIAGTPEKSSAGEEQNVEGNVRQTEENPESVVAGEAVTGLHVMSGGWVEEIDDVVWVPGNALLVVTPHTPASLQDVLRYDADMLSSMCERGRGSGDKTDHAGGGGGDGNHDPLGRSRALLLLCQVLGAVTACHRNGVSFGALDAGACRVDASSTLRLSPSQSFLPRTARRWRRQGRSTHGQRSTEGRRGVAALPGILPPGWSRYELMQAWTEGRRSNLEYLLALNVLGGRRFGDSTFHPILPWVIDMSRAPEACEEGSGEGEGGGGWRDLTATKNRLTRGDEQLDVTMECSSQGQGHHIAEFLSDLSYCIYKARRLPKRRLLHSVRAQWQPKEYPQSLERLYQWTPDEAIPEFFTDADVFRSTHADMEDLAVPSWAADAEDFVRQHRTALESDAVSRWLHCWIDLTFGYKLLGEAAQQAKNVPLRDPQEFPHSRGFPVLFTAPHPPRACVAHRVGAAAAAIVDLVSYDTGAGNFALGPAVAGLSDGRTRAGSPGFSDSAVLGSDAYGSSSLSSASSSSLHGETLPSTSLGGASDVARRAAGTHEARDKRNSGGGGSGGGGSSSSGGGSKQGSAVAAGAKSSGKGGASVLAPGRWLRRAMSERSADVVDMLRGTSRSAHSTNTSQGPLHSLNSRTAAPVDRDSPLKVSARSAVASSPVLSVASSVMTSALGGGVDGLEAYAEASDMERSALIGTWIMAVVWMP